MESPRPEGWFGFQPQKGSGSSSAHPRYNLTFEVNQSYNLIYGGAATPLFLEAAKRSLVLIFSKTSFPQWPFWNLPRLRSRLVEGAGSPPGCSKSLKIDSPAYARGIYFERTRKPLPDSLRRLLIYFFPRFGGILKPARETLKKRIRRIVTPPPGPTSIHHHRCRGEVCRPDAYRNRQPLQQKIEGRNFQRTK
ncbi:unnamed protein product [Lathyrus oleraceus]